jgi:hypothetical protein
MLVCYMLYGPVYGTSVLLTRERWTDSIRSEPTPKFSGSSCLAATTRHNSDTTKMWPDPVLREFQMVPANPLGSEFHGPYNKLLNVLFPPESEYAVAPRKFKPGTIRSPRRVLTFDITFRVDKLVLILQLKNPGNLDLASSRELADSQIRQHMDEHRGK